MPTVTLNLIQEVAEINKLPRAANVNFPFGSPAGNPNDAEKQLRVIKAALNLLEEAEEPGTIVELDFEWRD